MAMTSAGAPIVQAARRGLHVGDRSAIDAARAEFARTHGICLPGFLEPALAAALQRIVDRSVFRENVHRLVDPPPVELCVDDAAVYARLHLLVNDRRLFEVVEAITGCARIGCFAGRVYRMNPNAGHYDTWHDDVDDVRMVAMSVNLSPAPYDGGVLQLRARATQHELWRVHNVGFGDAILFNLGPNLEHRVTLVEGTAGKTAFAGWFLRSPDYETWFRAGLGARRSSTSRAGAVGE